MCNFPLVDILQSQNEFCSVEPSQASCEILLFTKHVGERAVFNILQHEVKVVFVLESSDEIYNIRMTAELLVNVPFSENTLDLVVLNDVIFFKNF